MEDYSKTIGKVKNLLIKYSTDGDLIFVDSMHSVRNCNSHNELKYEWFNFYSDEDNHDNFIKIRDALFYLNRVHHKAVMYCQFNHDAYSSTCYISVSYKHSDVEEYNRLCNQVWEEKGRPVLNPVVSIDSFINIKYKKQDEERQSKSI